MLKPDTLDDLEPVGDDTPRDCLISVPHRGDGNVFAYVDRNGKVRHELHTDASEEDAAGWFLSWARSLPARLRLLP